MTETSALRLGAVVRKVRRELCMSLRQFGGEVGATQATVWRWEHGEFLPDREHLIALGSLAPGFAEELKELWRAGRDEVSDRLKGRGAE